MTVSLDAMRSELTAAMADPPPGTSTADALCVTCVSLFGVDGAAVSVVLGGESSGTFGSSSTTSRRLDEYQFTYGEGPCLDAVASRSAVLVPDLDAPSEQRWPIYRGAVLGEGIRGIFVLPITIATVSVGALDLFRSRPGPLEGNALAGALLAAELAAAPLLDLVRDSDSIDHDDHWRGHTETVPPTPPAEVDRVEVYQATGILISALDVGADEALARLRAHALATDQTASQVARAIIERRLMLDRDGPALPGNDSGAVRGQP